MNSMPEDEDWRPRAHDRWIEPVFGALHPPEERRVRRSARRWLVAALVAAFLAWLFI